jgi:hypothetical protein
LRELVARVSKGTAVLDPEVESVSECNLLSFFLFPSSLFFVFFSPSISLSLSPFFPSFFPSLYPSISPSYFLFSLSLFFVLYSPSHNIHSFSISFFYRFY